LLNRLFSSLFENNPKLSRDKQRTAMSPALPKKKIKIPKGTRKTAFVNFMDLCITYDEFGSVYYTMHRQPENVVTFLLSEMETSGSLDGQQHLVVKDRFASKYIDGILHKFVICGCCKSPDTILTNGNHLFFLIFPIKAGFVARFGRRNTGA
ncbi:hypothetical protein CUMW_001670, partial [Citrus unshiu]